MTHPIRAKIEAATWWRDHLRSRRLLLGDRPVKLLMIARIQRVVADHFDIELADMHNHRTSSAVARPRMIAMYLARQLTQQSLPDIGRRFGGRDHSTVINALRRVEVWRSTDPELDRAITMLSDLLGKQQL